MNSHESFQKNHSIQISSDRSFGFVMGGFFLILGVWPLWKGLSVKINMIIISIVLLLIAVTIPRALRQLNVLWSKFGILLSKVTTPIVMGIIFFLVFTPIAVIVRSFGYEFLQLKFAPENESYWLKREPPGPAGDSMRKQF